MSLLTCLYFYQIKELRRTVVVARTGRYNRLDWQLSQFRRTLRLTQLRSSVHIYTLHWG